MAKSFLCSSLAFATVAIMLSTAAPAASAEDIAIEWVLPYKGPKQVSANVGDTITFSWDRMGHNVFIHPTMDCTLDGRIEVGKDGAGTTYSFVESDAGTDLFFACDIGGGGHCQAGE